MNSVFNITETYIITFHYPRNYGAFLQSYALQKICEAKICNYRAGYYMRVGKIRKYIPVLWRLFAKYRDAKFDKSTFPEYGMLKLSRLFINPFRNYKEFDGCVGIFGSDQIWNPTMIPQQEKIYFGDFTKFSKRISYAASLGMKQWPKDFEKRILPSLQKFDSISVREESSVEYLKSLGLKNVACVCDPTILHDGGFYRKEFKLKGSEISCPFVYKIREKIPEKVQEVLDDCTQQSKLVDLKSQATICSVTEWLSNIDNASFVVTDSFHCSVFCILFHKPFIVLANYGSGKGMNERFLTLLGKTGLLYRVLPQDADIEDIVELLNRSVDWGEIDLIMEEWRTYSANWLKKALES